MVAISYLNIENYAFHRHKIMRKYWIVSIVLILRQNAKIMLRENEYNIGVILEQYIFATRALSNSR